MDEIVLKVEGRSNEKNPFQEGETGKFEPPSFHEVKSFVSGISPSRLWITGGEPTMRNDLPAIIRVSGNFRHDVVVVTNGRRFSYLSYAETIASCGAKTFFVNLYSVEPEIHNALAGGDFFRQAADGIENLKKAGADVIVSCLVSKANIAGLGGVASFCSENGLGLHLIPARAAVENQKRLIPALKEVAGAVSSALRSALASGMDRNRLSYEQLPCCMMEEFKGLERAAIASRVHFPADGGAYSKPKPFPCLDCAILDGCPVAPAGYISAHGAFGLNPVGRHYSRDLAFRYKAAHPRFDPETCSRGSGAAYFDPSHALIDRGGADFDLFELSGKGELFESLYVKNAHGFMLEPQADSEESGVLYIHTACRKCLRLHRCAGVFSRFFGPDDEAAGPDSSWRKKAGYRPEKDKAAGFSRTAAFNPAYIEDAGKWLEQLLAETPCGETFSIQARFPAALLGEARHLKDELLLLPWKAVDMLKGGSVRLHSYDISPVRNGGKWTLTFA
ncbi:MAG: radical SAM protein, partial [Deltaproteobacteria bacterium]|nr:radical SAM protein [Deltaproteobacteria bacterium]